MVSSSIRLTAWLQNSEAGGTVREIDVWAESPRLSPLWLSALSSACRGLLIIGRDNAITYKAQRDKKCQRTEAGERAHQHIRAQRDVAALDAKYTKIADKAKMMLCVMMLPLVVVGCRIKQSVSQCEATTASGVDNAASPRLADTAERDYFTSESADHYAKTTGRNPY